MAESIVDLVPRVLDRAVPLEDGSGNDEVDVVVVEAEEDTDT